MTRTRIALAVVGWMALALSPTDAAAKVHREVEYRYDVVWPTALRYLRVDAGHTIVDKDAEAGYVVFDVADDGKVYRGSLELIKTKSSSGRVTVTVQVQIEDRPLWMERSLLEGLERKLRAEQGPPTAPPPRKKPAKDPPEDQAGGEANDQAPAPAE